MNVDKSNRADIGKLTHRWLNSKVILLKICGSFLIIVGIIIFRISVRDTLTLLNMAFGIELLQEASVSGFSAIGAIKAVVGGLLGLGGIFIFIYARKLRAAAFAKSTEQDSRPPVLYLRSFKDDPVMSRPGLFHITIPSVTTIEEQLAMVLNEIGPVTAIGKPGERLPALGARRLYVDDADWQEKVSELMAQSRLVIFRLAKTEGFWWELERAAATVSPERLVLLVPFKQKEYDAFKAKADSLFANPLPDYAGRNNGFLGLTGLIYFDADGAAYFTQFASLWSPKSLIYGRIRKPLLPYFKQVLQPVFSNLNVPWSQPKASLFALILSAFGFVALVGAIGWFGYLIFSNERTSSIDPAFLPCVERYDHPEIKSAMSGYSPEQAMQKAKQLSVKGLHRLDNEALLSRALIFSKFLSEADIHLCSRLVKGTITAKEIQFLVGKLDPQSRDLFCDIAFAATIAELRQISPPISLTESEIEKAFLNLMQSVPEQEADRLINVFNTIDQATDSDVCWLGKTLYGTISAMEEPYRSHMARALVME